jgi:type II secretory pathway component PulF
MKLAYLAFDKSGKPVSDTIDATNAAEAAETLRRKGLYVTKVSGAEAASVGAEPGGLRRRGGRRLKDLVMFTRQLQVLVSSGTPMVQSLTALERQAKPGPWRQAVSDVRSGVEQGASVSAAMESHPEYFDSICRSLIAAGESSGTVPEMLDRLATMSRKQLHLRSALIGAITYPCLLLTIAGGVLSLLLLFTVPRFGELFKNLGAPLPPTTRMLVSLSHLLRSYWWAVLLSASAGFTLVRLWLSTSAGRRAWDTAVLRLPQVGRIIKSYITARIIRLLGVLLDSHVPVLEALDLTFHAAGNYHYQVLISQARNAVTRGEPVSSAFDNSRLISPSVCEAVRSGEQSGQVGPLLLNIADFLDEENEVIIKSLTSILEPVILIMMGLLVALLATSMFIPLFDLTSMTGGGG